MRLYQMWEAHPFLIKDWSDEESLHDPINALNRYDLTPILVTWRSGCYLT